MSALSKLRILELSESVAGEYCGKLLSDFGAEVIKLERPHGGSPTRRLGPFGAASAAPEGSGLFAYLNTNKSSITVDIATVGGSSTLDMLLHRVDAVIDDHPPGWLKTNGVDPASFHRRLPRLVVCSITPYGQSPPENRMHAEDLTVFHSSGWGYHTPSAPDESEPPLKGAGRFYASYEAGLEAAMCTVAALYERESSNQGQFIDISARQVLASRLDYILGAMVAGDMDATTDRTAFDLQGPAGIFPCREGHAYFWIATQEDWEALRELLNKPEWMNSFPEHWLQRECTSERVAICRRYVGEWLKTQNKIEAAAKAQKLGIILVPVNDANDLTLSPQYASRHFFAEVDHPVLGRQVYPTVPYRLSATPAKIESPAPRLGQHTTDWLTLIDPAPTAIGAE